MLYYQIALSEIIHFPQLKQYIATRAHAVMLETAMSPETNKGYSIYAYAPEIILTKQNNVLDCIGYKNRDQLQDPLMLMQQILQKYSTKNHQELPFCGGFLGYLGYDYGQYLEKLPQQSRHDIELPDLYMGFYPVAMVIDHQAQQLNICGIENQQPFADTLYQLCQQTMPLDIQDFHLTSEWKSNMTESEYQQKFAVVMQHIIEGDCYQVNLAQRWKAQYKGHPYQAYCTIRVQNSAPYSAYINLEKAAIMSVSPESFIAVKNGHCESKPIKGTRPRSNDKKQDQALSKALLQSKKDRAENVMIVDLIRNDFSKVCKINSVKVDKLCELESFAAVHHLVSTISGQLETGKYPTDLLTACFPGGSITGAPKISAMKIIETLEPHKRSIYCGSIGYFSCNGKMDTSICIRTLVCVDDTIYCWAGGGIVVDSVVDDEFKETQQKVSKILPVLTQTMKTN